MEYCCKEVDITPPKIDPIVGKELINDRCARRGKEQPIRHTILNATGNCKYFKKKKSLISKILIGLHIIKENFPIIPLKCCECVYWYDDSYDFD